GTLAPSFLNYTGAGTSTISSVIAGSGSIQVNGAATGVLVLSGANTFANTSLTLTSGTLSVGAENNLGDISSSLQLNGGTFQVTGTTFQAFNATRNVSTYNSAFDIAAAGNNFTISPNGNSGGGTLVKLGLGTLTVAGTTSYSSSANSSIRAGTLEVSGNLSLATTANLGIEIAPSAGQTAAVVVDSGAVLNTERTIIGGNQGNTSGGAGTLTVNSGIINSAQWFTVGSFGSSTSTATLNGASIVNVNSATGTQVEVADFGAASGILNINGTSQLNIYSNGDLALGVQNNATGSGTVNQNGGTVTFYSDTGSTVGGTGGLRMGKGTGLTGTMTYNLNAGQLIVPTVTRTSGTAVFNFNGGTIIPTASTTTFMAGLTTAQIKSGGALVNNNGFNITIGQALLHDTTVGAPAIDGGLNSSGAGILTLTGTNTFTGNTTVAGGTLIAGSTGALENSALATGGAGFQFASTVASHAFSIGGLSGSNGLSLTDNAATPNNVILSVGGVTTAVNSTFSGALSGGGGLTKINANSTFKLTGASSYTGATRVSAGTLALGAQNAIANTASVTLAGGTLSTGGFSQNFTASAIPATLGLTANSILDLGSTLNNNPEIVQFANSSAVTWTANTLLRINNWSGTPVAGSAADATQLVVGADATGLTSTQALQQIHFTGHLTGATVLDVGSANPGEVVPNSTTLLLKGDFNQDLHVNSQDIDAMMAALVNLTNYAAGTTSIRSNNMVFDAPDLADVGDFDGDNIITNADLQGMLYYLQTGHGSASAIGGTSAVPEPSSFILMGCVAPAIWLLARRRKAKSPFAVAA
ncbi:MAG TPA: autotransporter-associated beta strand repeat-containing protein, partial [Pirellulales bacterium]